MTAFQTFWASNNNRTGIGIALGVLAGAVAFAVTKNNDDAAAAVGMAFAVWKIVDPDFVAPPSAVKIAEDVAAAAEKPSVSGLGVVIADAQSLTSKG